MSTRTHDTKPPNSNCGENSFTSKALEAFQMLSRALNLQVPLYAYTLFTIIFAILFQITLKSRKRIRTLETERQGFEDAREELRGEIEALREEMRSVREVDREEKLCLVETVKQVLRQGNGTANEDNMVDEAYSGSQIQKTVSLDEDEDCVDDHNSSHETLIEEDTSCPWCSHAHLLRLGGCAGDDTCDGSVHIPYCPSCFYNEGKGHGQETIDLDTVGHAEETPAVVVGLNDGETEPSL
ncbi:hypothetical protein DL95DRAFT_462797 [Leptodontidium sp. 2 PMI_412]|nr:hypothetical protein DL95DRAFT_462797 [Leptodontidium sp. 2 PMI_412]